MIFPSSIKKVLVTGATGFLAHGLIEKLLSMDIQVSAVARNEGKLIALKNTFPLITINPCPIEDFHLLKKACLDCDGIFHLASFKDVILSGEHPLKTVQTNILGTLNILKLSVENENIKFIVNTSTDKATKVSSVYGATKLIVESLFLEYEKINPFCSYRIVRYGNVFYSTGSVLVKWKNALLNNKEIILTEPSATRYFWSREEAIECLFECLYKSNDATPLIPKMRSISVGDLLEIMIKKYSPFDRPAIKVIGLQNGENLHEELTNQESSLTAERWDENELLLII